MAETKQNKQTINNEGKNSEVQWPSSLALALSPGSGRGSMGIEEQEAFLAVIPAGLSITHAGGGGGVGVEGEEGCGVERE